MPITHEYEDEALPSTPSHVQAKHEYEDELSLEDTAATLENLSLSNPPAQGGDTFVFRLYDTTLGGYCNCSRGSD